MMSMPNAAVRDGELDGPVNHRAARVISRTSPTNCAGRYALEFRIAQVLTGADQPGDVCAVTVVIEG
jgi:hypothetical protein